MYRSFPISFLFAFFFITVAIGQSDYSLFNQLVDKSDVVIMGRIDNEDCIVKEMGVRSCLYWVHVDSIFKGTLSEEEYLGIAPRLINQPKKSSNIISLRNSCYFYLYTKLKNEPPHYFKDNCIENGDYYILFLTRHVKGKNRNFILSDQWLGYQPANSYLASYLRSYCSKFTKE